MFDSIWFVWLVARLGVMVIVKLRIKLIIDTQLETQNHHKTKQKGTWQQSLFNSYSLYVGMYTPVHV